MIKCICLEKYGGQILKDNDYIIVCSNIGEEISKLKKGKIIRYDFLRLCAYHISPESAYLDIKLRKKIDIGGIQGVITGLSYEQRGLNFERLEKNFICLATPSQDLFLDYQNFLWLYNEVLIKRQEKIEYCIIGMDFYRLWYDLSLSSGKRRMLCFYKRLKTTHHFHEVDNWLLRYEEDLKCCEELLIENYMDEDFNNNFCPELYYKKIMNNMK